MLAPFWMIKLMPMMNFGSKLFMKPNQAHGFDGVISREKMMFLD